MSRRTTGVPLNAALVRFRLKQLTLLAVLGFVMAVFVVGSSEVRDSAQSAIEDSIRADQGQRAYATQTGNPAAVKVLARNENFAPVADEQADVEAGGLRAPVLIRTSQQPTLTLGVLSQGRHPSADGDATLSTATAQTLEVALGDSLDAVFDDGREIRARVVGITVDPADKTTNTMVVLDPSSSPERATTWLSEKDPYSFLELQSFLDRRTATYQSVDALATQGSDNPPRFLAALRHVPVAMGLLFLTIIVSTLALLRTTARRDVDGLVAAGMSDQAAWRQMLRAAFGAVLLGQLVGGLAVSAVIFLLREQISGIFGQQWVGVSVPWAEFGLTLVLTLAIGLAASKLARTFRAAFERFGAAKTRRAWALPAAVIVLTLGFALELVALASSLQSPPGSASLLAPWASALIVAALPFVIGFGIGRGLARATRVLFANLSTGLRTVVMVAAVVALVSGTYASTTTHDANVNEGRSGQLQPPGSFLVFEIPNSAAGPLLETYREQGGSHVEQYEIPDETNTNLRVTGVRLISCMSKAGTRDPNVVENACFPQETYTPINTVVLGPRTKPVATADPGLVKDGKVGLLLFKGETGKASILTDTDARADPRLGGNMPGLVIPKAGRVAKYFDLQPGNTSLVAFLDFSDLTPRGQARLRAAVARFAPGAQTADGTNASGYASQRSVANATAFVGATIVSIVVLVGGAAVTLGHRRTRRMLVDIGAGAGYRQRLASRWIAIPGLCFLICIPMTLLSTSIAGINAPASNGHLWILPSAAGLLSSALLGAIFLTVPARASE